MGEQIVHPLEHWRVDAARSSDNAYDSAHGWIDNSLLDQRLIAAIFPAVSQAPARKNRAQIP
jgi:hypothetical protein